MCESVCLFLETSDGVVSNEVNNSNEINNTDGGSIRIARLHSTIVYLPYRSTEQPKKRRLKNSRLLGHGGVHAGPFRLALSLS